MPSTQAQWGFEIRICQAQRLSGFSEAFAKRTGTVGFSKSHLPSTQAQCVFGIICQAHKHNGGFEIRTCQARRHSGFSGAFAKHTGTNGAVRFAPAKPTGTVSFQKHLLNTLAQWGFEIRPCQTRRHTGFSKNICQTHRHSVVVRFAPAKHTGTVGFQERLQNTWAQWGFRIRTCQAHRHSGCSEAFAKHTGTVGF